MWRPPMCGGITVELPWGAYFGLICHQPTSANKFQDWCDSSQVENEWGGWFVFANLLFLGRICDACIGDDDDDDDDDCQDPAEHARAALEAQAATMRQADAGRGQSLFFKLQASLRYKMDIK